jgi:hypothetical protein
MGRTRQRKRRDNSGAAECRPVSGQEGLPCERRGVNFFCSAHAPINVADVAKIGLSPRNFPGGLQFCGSAHGRIGAVAFKTTVFAHATATTDRRAKIPEEVYKTRCRNARLRQ